MSDKLRLAFHTACDQAEYSAAEQLLNQLCKETRTDFTLPLGSDRRRPENLSGACERLANLLLWQIESPTESDDAPTEDPPPPDGSRRRKR